MDAIYQYYKILKALRAAQKAERLILEKYGIPASAIDELHEHDHIARRGNRVYVNHNSTSSEGLGEAVVDMIMYKRNQTTDMGEGVYDWRDSIENPALFAELMALSPDELALVVACWLEGVSQKEYAKRIKRSPSSVNERLKRIQAKMRRKLK